MWNQPPTPISTEWTDGSSHSQSQSQGDGEYVIEMDNLPPPKYPESAACAQSIHSVPPAYDEREEHRRLYDLDSSTCSDPETPVPVSVSVAVPLAASTARVITYTPVRVHERRLNRTRARAQQRTPAQSRSQSRKAPSYCSKWKTVMKILIVLLILAALGGIIYGVYYGVTKSHQKDLGAGHQQAPKPEVHSPKPKKPKPQKPKTQKPKKPKPEKPKPENPKPREQAVQPYEDISGNGWWHWVVPAGKSQAEGHWQFVRRRKNVLERLWDSVKSDLDLP
ncbi:uncharacterized protein DSM5745_06731 [Aspergillus mulundensis]|uniref:Uncharacterized protein n=1 Tax=Aspergillus mulundensis TaxID=1810919 RepID=A0A3D8RRQ8_9EURO|nr:hypothetical protein DSM5745_06731 [Aspergillus mulundensis]RDW76739.1 hypothetical protein DSM5745_06731 [Aspergillus mulundensis]